MRRRVFIKSALAASAASFLPPFASNALAKPNLGSWGAGKSAEAYLGGNFGPVAEESTIVDLVVDGVLPKELTGRYVRNGPNPSGPVNAAGHHWFVGDGMVHGIRVRDGSAEWYRNRYVIGGPNTHVVGHAGKTLAIVEAGTQPVELSYELDSIGPHDFNGTLKQGFSAHPKRDPDTGELHVMTYNPGPPPWFVQYVVVDKDGSVRKTVDIPVAGPAMVHDTSITKNWVVVYDLPVTANIELAQKGFRFPMQWNPGYGARVGLLPRNGGADDVVWCEVPISYVFHPMNAYETDSGEVVLDVCRYDRMFDGNYNGPFDDKTELTLDRWTVNPKTRNVRSDRIDDRAQEFPRAHPGLEGKPYRYGYSVTVAGRSFPQILKHDLTSGRTQVHELGAGRSSGEAVFVPKQGASREDEGYLMAWIYDAARKLSEFTVLDAEGMETIATVKLPVRVPYGFHGSWIADIA